MPENGTLLDADVVDVASKSNASSTRAISGSLLSALASPELLSFYALELKLVLSALGIIYLSAHASLGRPHSAAPVKRKGRDQSGRKDKSGKDEADDESDERTKQGLLPSDAIFFPLLAGVMLIGLYYLIQYLKDPKLLNLILRWYMSTVSIASLVSFYTHSMELVTSLVFPSFWKGRDGALRKVDQKTRQVWLCDTMGNKRDGQVAVDSIPTPLPGALGLLTAWKGSRKSAWTVRGLLTRRWTVRFHAGTMDEQKGRIKSAHIIAVLLSLLTAIVYFATSSPTLSNLLGYGMCYGSLLIITPTNFLTSALVLGGLFFYDIVMVFYTPYMVTVATTLDVPIKLTFETGARKSILGLGDIIIPGMVMAWTLRLDLWRHYSSKFKYEEAQLTVIEKDAESGAVVQKKETKFLQVKAPYISAKGTWGERLWVDGISGFLPSWARRGGPVPPELAAANFPKVYFHASLVGYCIGMLVTLAMLLVYKRGQPALLYLVPGVLGSLTLTALARGEWKQLWTYTEDGTLDTMDVVVDLDEKGKPMRTIGKALDGVVDTTKCDKNDESQAGETKGTTPSDDEAATVGKESVDSAAKEGKKEKGTGKNSVFHFSIEMPSEDEDGVDEP